MKALLTLALGSIMERTKFCPKFMGGFVVPHAVEHLLAKASKDVVFGLCIPLLVFLLYWSKSGVLG